MSRVAPDNRIAKRILKYPTAADIEDMKARGFDPTVIAEAVERFKRGQIAEQLKLAIRGAFAGVTLGTGIGLQEAQCIDDGKNDKTRAACREQDEKENWGALPAEHLDRCNSSLFYFDAEGMRFHLPAYLVAALDGAFGFDLPYTLATAVPDDDRFTLLDTAQRETVREFLRFFRDEPDHAADRVLIQQALAAYWAS
jgi:hypothetical protein